jgi:hypothetical protein
VPRTKQAKHIVDIKQKRVDEDYILNQWEQTTKSESHEQRLQRLARVKRLARGDWSDFPQFADIGADPWIENPIKNGIRDIANLASEAQASVVFTPKGDGVTAEKGALVRGAIERTIWEKNRGHRYERLWYMDAIMAGFMVAALYKSKRSPYAQFVRLDPEMCYPEVRNGMLSNLLYTETIKKREAARMYPEFNLDAEDWSDQECQLVDYYDDKVVVKALLLTQGGKISPDNRAQSAFIVDEWEHGLDCAPVAFEQLDSEDGAFRGIMDQAAGPTLARNSVVKYLIDYMESMVHAPFKERGVMNGTQAPGPDTVYHLDRNDPNSDISRVAPAAPAGAVFGLIQYLEGQTNNETVQPESRVGNVKQSIASASFVVQTQGRLTSVVKELQDMMQGLRAQITEVSFAIEEKWLDEEKPLVLPIGKKYTYKPSADIAGWCYNIVQFGAAAGLDRLQADQRILQHLGAKLISRETGRQQLDYIANPMEEQNKIDAETVADAIMQRWAADPQTPLDILLEMNDLQQQGKTLGEAITEVRQKVAEAQQAQQQGAPGGQNSQATPPVAPGPGAEGEALAAGSTNTAPAQLGQPVQFAPPPFEQIRA